MLEMFTARQKCSTEMFAKQKPALVEGYSGRESFSLDLLFRGWRYSHPWPLVESSQNCCKSKDALVATKWFSSSLAETLWHCNMPSETFPKSSRLDEVKGFHCIEIRILCWAAFEHFASRDSNRFALHRLANLSTRGKIHLSTGDSNALTALRLKEIQRKTRRGTQREIRRETWREIGKSTKFDCEWHLSWRTNFLFCWSLKFELNDFSF